MMLSNLKRASGLLLATAMFMNGDSAPAQSATNDTKLNAESFATIHRKIRPQNGESRWMEIPWLTDLHEARRKAAAEGKPLFLMVSGKGISIGMC